MMTRTIGMAKNFNQAPTFDTNSLFAISVDAQKGQITIVHRIGRSWINVSTVCGLLVDLIVQKVYF